MDKINAVPNRLLIRMIMRVINICFMTFIGKHKSEPMFKAWLAEGFRAFIDVHVKCFEGWANEPVHFIGSVAYHFQEELRAECAKDGIEVGQIIKKPIDGLAAYHLKHILPHVES